MNLGGSVGQSDGTTGQAALRRLVDAERQRLGAPLTLLMAYPTSWEDAGGGAFVDRILRAALTEGATEPVFVTNRLTASGEPTRDPALASLPLQVRRSKGLLAKSALRMGFRREAYFVAKFRSSRHWSAAKWRLHETTRQPVVATSFLPLLLATDANVRVLAYVAQNCEWELARRFSPSLLRNDWLRLQAAELAAMQKAEHLFAWSHLDAVRLTKLAGRPVTPMAWHFAKFAKPQKPMLSEGHIRIGYLGSYSWPPNQNDIRTLVYDLLPELATRGIEATLVLAGRGTEDAPSAQNVRRLGRIDNLDRFYDQIDIIVVPRLETTTGVSVKVAEALSRGLVVVSSQDVSSALGSPPGIITVDGVDHIATVLAELESQHSFLDLHRDE